MVREICLPHQFFNASVKLVHSKTEPPVILVYQHVLNAQIRYPVLYADQVRTEIWMAATYALVFQDSMMKAVHY